MRQEIIPYVRSISVLGVAPVAVAFRDAVGLFGLEAPVSILIPRIVFISGLVLQTHATVIVFAAGVLVHHHTRRPPCI